MAATQAQARLAAVRAHRKVRRLEGELDQALDQRAKAVRAAQAAGFSLRAIAQALGVGSGETVRRMAARGA